jgi:hypothetical protein
MQIPLERDEGEYAYIGQLMLQGIPPYLLAYNMKLPGIYAIYTLIMAIFGQTITGIHLGLLFFNTAAIVLLFLLVRRLFDDITSVIAAFVYAMLSLSPTVFGTSAHATQFIVPFMLASTLLLIKALDSDKYWMVFASGLLYGLTFIIKQHAIFYIFFAVFYFIAYGLLKIHTERKRLVLGASILLAASVIPFLISCIMLYTAGVFSQFWFWTFTYAHQYVSIVPLSEGLHIFMIQSYKVIRPWEWVWVTAGLGLTGIFWDEKAKSNWIFLTGFSLFSFLTIVPGFYFRKHYFVTLLPVIALLAGVAISAMIRLLSARKMPSFVKVLPIIFIVTALIFPTYELRNFFFKISPVEACRMMYDGNPFPESIEIAEYIQNHSVKDDKIAILGSEPQICFYANRKSATGYIYVYGLMEPQDYAINMQKDMIQEIETTRPKYAVLVDIPYSWLPDKNSNMLIINWALTYLKKNYRTVGIFDISRNSYSAFWENNLKQYKPISSNNIFVMERIKGLN